MHDLQSLDCSSRIASLSICHDFIFSVYVALSFDYLPIC